MMVVANMNTKTALANAALAARTAIEKIALDTENYDASALTQVNAMISAANAALDAENLTQAAADILIGEIAAALDALTHTHTILENSAPEGKPLTEWEKDVTIRIKGSFGSVQRVTLNEKSFDLSPVSATRQNLTMDGTHSGTLSSGSANVALDADYVDTLDNGTYTVEVAFEDGYREGAGIAIFVVNREKPDNTDPNIPPKQPSNSGTPSNSGGSGSLSVPAGTGGTSNTASGQTGTATSENSGGNSDEAEETAAVPNPTDDETQDDAGAPADEETQIAAERSAGIWIAIAAILLIAALFLFLAFRRRKREKNEEQEEGEERAE
jgi:hypothetical protein